MKISLRSLAIALVLFISMITGTSVAQADSWQKCTAGSYDCPAFFDLYPKDKAFSTAFNQAIRRAGIRKPNWLSRSTAAPAELLPNGSGTSFLLFACKPHECGGDLLYTIYDPRSNLVRGMRWLDGDMTFFGELSVEEKNLLLSKFK